MLSPSDYNQLVTLLSQQRSMLTTLERQNILAEAGLDDLVSMVPLDLPARSYASALVRELRDIGTHPSTGELALVIFLRVIRKHTAGQTEAHGFIEGLIRQLSSPSVYHASIRPSIPKRNSPWTWLFVIISAVLLVSSIAFGWWNSRANGSGELEAMVTKQGIAMNSTDYETPTLLRTTTSLPSASPTPTFMPAHVVPSPPIMVTLPTPAFPLVRGVWVVEVTITEEMEGEYTLFLNLTEDQNQRGILRGSFASPSPDACSEGEIEGVVDSSGHEISWVITYTGNCCKNAQLEFNGSVNDERTSVSGSISIIRFGNNCSHWTAGSFTASYDSFRSNFG